MIVTNAAVFENGRKKYTRVNADVVGDKLLILNGTTNAEFVSYDIQETAKVGMAWDAVDESGKLIRVTIQAGCGCGGMKAYSEDSTYKGNLTPRG